MFTNPVKCKQCGQAFRDSKRESAWSKLEDHVQLMHGRRASYKSKAAALRRVRKSRESAEEAEGPAPLTGYLSYEGYENPSADISLIPWLNTTEFLLGPARQMGLDLGAWEMAAVLHTTHGSDKSAIMRFNRMLSSASAERRAEVALWLAALFETDKVQSTWNAWLQTLEGNDWPRWPTW